MPIGPVNRSAIKGLGEVNLWVKDLKGMRSFYVGILGLTPIHESGRHIFLKVAEGNEGLPQVVALFDSNFPGARARPDVKKTTLNHIAFSIGLKEFAGEKKRLKSLGLDVKEELHPEPHWRSLYFHDPEGNQIELVAFDKSVK